jgi:putative membrane protein
MGAMPPPFHWTSAWQQWNVNWVPSIILIAALGLYLLGTRRVAGWSTWRTMAFASAVFTTFIATQSVLGVYDMVLFADHMVQHLLLIMVAAPLFALAAPLDLASASLRGTPRQMTNEFIDGPVGMILLHPITDFALYAVFIPATHLSNLMNLTMEHLWLHHLEQISFLVVGYLFFRSVFGIERGPRALHPGLALVYLMAAVPVDTFTGLALAMTSHNPFPVYDTMMRPWGPSVLSDVHLGGAIMWIGGDALMLLALIPASLRWVRFEDRRTRQIDRDLDAARPSESP